MPASRSRPPTGVDKARAREPDAALPAWAGAQPDWLPRLPPDVAPGLARLAPSRPEGVELGQVPPSNSPLAASGARFERGRLLHALLQHLPDLPEAERPEAARAYLTRQSGLDPAAQAVALAELLAVLAEPALAAAFGPGSRAEVPLTGVVAGQVVGGLVDRLAVLPDRVLLVDYKTNRQPPATAAATPPTYLRQMAAYRAVLAAIHPGRPVECVLVWTSGARVMVLPPGLLDGFAPGARAAA